MDVRFIDTTFRDGSQSLWAIGLRSGMMEDRGGGPARAGFQAVEVPVVAISSRNATSRRIRGR
jgi:oxaloacetate decarboxylase alpha subunit